MNFTRNKKTCRTQAVFRIRPDVEGLEQRTLLYHTAIVLPSYFYGSATLGSKFDQNSVPLESDAPKKEGIYVAVSNADGPISLERSKIGVVALGNDYDGASSTTATINAYTEAVAYPDGYRRATAVGYTTLSPNPSPSEVEFVPVKIVPDYDDDYGKTVLITLDLSFVGSNGSGMAASNASTQYTVKYKTDNDTITLIDSTDSASPNPRSNKKSNSFTTTVGQTFYLYVYMRSQSTNGGLEADLTLDITATDTNGSGGGGSGGGGSLKATNDSYTATSGQPLRVSTPGVLANDSGSQLTVLNHGIASHGSLTVSTNGSFTYTPAAGYTGTDSFTYTVKDSGSQTATGTVFINVRGGGGGGNGGGGAPIAFSDSYTVIGGQSLKIANPASGVLSNDLGRSGSQIFAVLDSYGASHGLVSLNLDGTFTYTPYADFVGADSFTYRASYVASFHMASELSEASQPTLVTIFVTRPPIPHFIGLWNPIHSRKKLTQITVAFDQALDEVSAEQSVHYILRLATKKRRRTVYLKSVRVRSVVYDPSNHTVILSLKKPTKGRFELTILSGILGVTGFATQESTVVYVS